MPAKPAKGTLNNPAMGQDLEALDVIGTFDDLQAEFSYDTEVSDPLNETTSVSTVSPDESKARKAILRLVQHKYCTVTVLNVRRMNNGYQYEAKNVDHDVAFASLDFLACIIAARPPFSVVFTD